MVREWKNNVREEKRSKDRKETKIKGTKRGKKKERKTERKKERKRNMQNSPVFVVCGRLTLVHAPNTDKERVFPRDVRLLARDKLPKKGGGGYRRGGGK